MMERAEAVRRLRMISDGIDSDEFPQNRNVRNHAAKTQTALSLAIEALSSPAIDKAREALRVFVEAVDSNQLHIDSPRLSNEHGSWQWHEEWLANVREALAALKPPAPTHRHIKRGSTYVELERGELQTSRPLKDGDVLVAYRGDDGRWWFRPPDEFDDPTRFAALRKPEDG